jgi:hypothetical protein
MKTIRLPCNGDDDVEIRIELLVSYMVENMQRPNPELPLDAKDIAGLKHCCTGLLRLNGLPVPSDGYLDELVRDMCDWHQIPVAVSP